MEQPRKTPESGWALLHGELTEQVIGAFFEVYRILRHGYLESTYAGAMALEMADRGMHFGPEANFWRIINSRRRGEPSG